jgi:hypothetical protein
MSKWITKTQIKEFVKDKKFKSEKEFEEKVIPYLAKLFKVKLSQIDNQSITTSFDRTLSNCADIIITTDDKFEKAIVVIELKLARNIEKYHGGNYDSAKKQLDKYCQDTRAPYGILLTDETCFVFRYKYFVYNEIPERTEGDKLPNIRRIEDRMALDSFLDFVLHKKSLKYIYIFFGLVFAIYFLAKFIVSNNFKF